MKKNVLVFQSDFGLQDGAVAAMYGVALNEDPDLHIYNLTHDIPPFDIYEASYRLLQAVPYYPEGTVFVSVVDPGVGSNRKSVVAKTLKGHYIVTPDNGSLYHIKKMMGIEEIREIEEAVGRRKNTENSYTFHGRDVYAFTGAKLAAGTLKFEDVGQLLSVDRIVSLEETRLEVNEDDIIGTIETLDVRFGSLWTNISREVFDTLHIKPKEEVDVTIYNGKRRIYRNRVVYGHTFADVEMGDAICYINSMDHVAIAINQGNFAKAYNVGTKDPWYIELKKIR